MKFIFKLITSLVVILVIIGVCAGAGIIYINKKYDIDILNNVNQLKKLSKEVQKEPEIALDGGYDGLDFYRRILDRAINYLKTGSYLCLEIGYDQKIDVIELIENEEKYKDTYSKKDLYGNDRIVITKLS